MERKKYLYAALAIGGLAIAGGAFTKTAREKILERDGHKCVLCGSTSHLEAAHIWHDKLSPNYNDTSNGRTLCVADHLKDHVNRHGRNGLPPEKNKWSINILKKKVQSLVE